MSTRSIVRLYHQFEEVARNSDMSIAQYRMLALLQQKSKRASQLAASAAVKRPTISALLKDTRAKGWIADQLDPRDGRVVRVVMTPAGRARLRAFDNALAARFEAVVRGADLDRVHSALAEVYPVLRQNLDEARPAKKQRRPRKRLKRHA